MSHPNTVWRSRFSGGVFLLVTLVFPALLLYRPEASPAQTNSADSSQLRRFAQHDPNRKILFTITLEENGKAGAEVGWSMKGVGRYALLPTWDGFRGIDLSLGRSAGLGKEPKASAEDLFELRGGLIGLKEGEVLQFYLKEADMTGSGSLPGEKHSWGESRRDGKTTVTVDGDTGKPTQEALADLMDARLVRTKTGAKLEFGWWMQPDGGTTMPVSATVCGFSNPESARVLTFNLTNDDLRNWDRIAKSNQGVIHHDEDASVTGALTATLSPAPLPKEEIEVTVVPETRYESWIPKGNIENPKEPGEYLKISVSVHNKDGKPRDAYLSVSFPYVSKNRGVCGNYPKGAGEEEGLRFREKDFVGANGLLFKDRTHLESDVLLQEAEFRVGSYDYGAWGTMRITAKDADGKELKVKVKGTEWPDLDIPRDEDGNRVADAYERTKFYGHPRDEDVDIVSGQDATGDGITLYNEYRGLMVLNSSGAREYQRLKPDIKEMFVIDSAKKFPLAKWESVSGIRPYRVDDSMVDPTGNTPGKSPLVNFNSADKESHPFYALQIRVRSDSPADNTNPAFAQSDYTIKSATAVSVFPARIAQRINEDFNWLDTAIRNPDSPDGNKLKAELTALRFTYEDALAAHARLKDPAVRNAVTAKLQTAIMLHEVGHVCGRDDHDNYVPPKDLAMQAWGCLMTVQGWWGRMRTLVNTALGRGDPDIAFPYTGFCRDFGLADKGYHCYKSLKIKDW